MSTPTHTAGPWVVYEQPGSYPGSIPTIHVHVAGRPKLAPSVAHLSGTMDYREGLANARLIAAAPELLEALRALLVSINVAIDQSEGDTFGKHHNNAVDAITAAEQAIAKAGG